MRARLTILLSLMSVLSLSAGVAAGTGATPPSLGDLSKPRDAGIRYGQAAGMAAVCLDMKPTQKAEALATSFTGSDLEKFKIQAETVLQSWKKTLTCANKADPNPCRLAHQMSCMEGYKEIGPGGTVAPGLVEMTKAQ
jgi:hypothetical protein